MQEQFAPFAQHPAVVTASELRESHGISHDAPIGLAVNLDRVRLAPMAAIDPDELDPRWHGVAVEAFLEQVRDFAIASRFVRFVEDHVTYTSAAEDRIAHALEQQQITKWFETFLGKKPGASFTVVPGLLVGGWSYDAHARTPSGRENVYMVVSLENVDEAGLPRPTHLTIMLVVHEMAHSYINPVVEQHLAVLEPGASKLYEVVQPAMENQAYRGWKLMVEESIVRAFTILYLHTKVSEEAARETIRAEERRSFLWMAELVDQLVPIAAQVGRTQQPADVGEVVVKLAPFFEQQATKWAR